MAQLFLNLSDDLIVKISSYLCDNPQEIVALSLTCQYLYHLIHFHSSPLWFDLYSHHLSSSRANGSLTFTPQRSWKSYFIEIYPFVRHSVASSSSSSEPPIHIQHITPPALLRRSGHSINSFHQDYIVQFGGATTDFHLSCSYDLFVISPDQSLRIFHVDQHFSFPSIARRWLHTGTTIGSRTHKKVLIYGGMGNQTLADLLLLELFLPEGDGEGKEVDTPQVICSRIPRNASSPSPSPRAGHSAIVFDAQRDGIDNSIFIFGGKVEKNSSSLESLSNEIWHLDCNGCLNASHSVMWRKINPTGSPPCQRWCHSAIRNQDSMIVFGGWTHASDSEASSHVFLNDLFVFDLGNETWNEIITSGLPPCPRCQAPVMFWNSLVTGSYSHEASGNEGQRAGYLVIYGGAYHSLEVTKLPLYDRNPFSPHCYS